MSNPLDRRLLIALQALVVGLPLFLGGRQSTASFLAAVVVLGLLALTLRERRRRGGGPHAPGVGALVAFVALALATTLPLPPALIQAVSPSAARLYGDMLPGWPDAGGWSSWQIGRAHV